MGPLGNGRTWKISRLGVLGTLPTPGNLFEVGVRASLNEFDVSCRGGIGRSAPAHGQEKNVAKTLSSIWFETHQKELEKYIDQCVAVGPKGVLAHNSSLDKVVEKVPNDGADVMYAFIRPPAPTIIRQ